MKKKAQPQDNIKSLLAVHTKGVKQYMTEFKEYCEKELLSIFSGDMNKQKGSVGLIIGIVVALVLIGGGYYYLSGSKTEPFYRGVYVSECSQSRPGQPQLCSVKTSGDNFEKWCGSIGGDLSILESYPPILQCSTPDIFYRLRTNKQK